MRFLSILLPALLFASAVTATPPAPVPQISTPMPDLSAMPTHKPASVIDMTVVLLDDQDKPIIAFPDEKDLSGEQKWARGALAEKIENNPHATLDSNQIVLIEKLLGKLYNGMIVTRVYPLLDPNKEPPALVP
jgi:hypothetical protein